MLDARARHGRALTGFTTVVASVADPAWDRPTPCDEWDARTLVEHVIGFHEFLLLRPLGLRAHRPREDPGRRWLATEAAVRRALAAPMALDQEVEYFDGANRRPGEVLAALATDTLIHTWDLARAVDAPDRLDRELCELAYAEAVGSAADRVASAMFGPEVPVAAEADIQDRVLGLAGRDPAWSGPPVGT